MTKAIKRKWDNLFSLLRKSSSFGKSQRFSVEVFMTQIFFASLSSTICVKYVTEFYKAIILQNLSFVLKARNFAFKNVRTLPCDHMTSVA